MRVYRLRWIVLTLLVCACMTLGVSAQDDATPPIWQAGNSIHDALFDAQQAMLSAEGDPNATTYYQQAADAIQSARALYQQAIQPELRSSAPDVEQGDQGRH